MLLLALPLYLISCKPTQKLPFYLDGVNDSTVKTEVKVPELRIQKNDLISIQVYSLSTMPEKSDAIYNQPPTGGTGTASVEGYLVDEEGNIYHHRLGSFHAEGLTKKELAAEVRKRLVEPVELLKDPTVVVRFLNFKITVLGEVGQAGVINIPGNSVTILEAVGMAGGISDFGKKNTVKVLREANGVRETGIIDLSSKEIFDSPYYNLVQNDVVVVDATNQKIKDADDARTIRKVSFAFTMVTVAATIANIFFRN